MAVVPIAGTHRLRWLLMIATSFVFWIASTARAQEPSPVADDANKSVEALALFNQGMRALSREMLGPARELFETSLRLHPHPATAFNLAVTSRRMGDPASALQILTSLTRGQYGVLLTDQQEEAAALAKAVASETGVIRVAAPATAMAQLSVDGLPIDVPFQNGVFTKHVNPGRHEVQWRAPGFAPWLAAVQANTAEAVLLTPHLTPDVPAPTARAGSALASEPQALWLSRHWVWVVAAGVLAAGAAIVIYQSTNEPNNGGVFGVTRTLRTP